MKHLTISLSFILLVSACIYDECPDDVAHDFTQTELDWFSFESGDTVFYKDAQSGEIHYLTATSQEFTTESTFNEDHNCLNGGYYDISDVMNNEITSDFPHYTNDFTKIDMHVVTLGLTTSVLNIRFNGYTLNPDSYNYDLLFDNNLKVIRATSGGTIISEIEQIDSIRINGNNYLNAFIICFSKDDELNFACYDTIYYNQDGFLKFISSQYGHRLEILE
jgi:hypothetical protein